MYDEESLLRTISKHSFPRHVNRILKNLPFKNRWTLKKRKSRKKKEEIKTIFAHPTIIHFFYKVKPFPALLSAVRKWRWEWKWNFVSNFLLLVLILGLFGAGLLLFMPIMGIIIVVAICKRWWRGHCKFNLRNVMPKLVSILQHGKLRLIEPIWVVHIF